MLKASAIKRLTNNNIANALAPFFESHSFKFVKGKHSFIKVFDEEITQIVEISNIEWGFDDDTNNHYLFFELKYGLETPQYSKWHLEQTGEEFLKHRVKTIPIKKIQCYLTLDLMEIPVEDVNVYGLTSPSQRFKRFIALSLTGLKYPEKESIISVEEFNTIIAQVALNSFNHSSNLQFIFEQNAHELWLDFLHIQAYLGNIEIVKPYYQKCYDKSLPNIKELLKTKSQYLKENLDWFKEFILTVEKLAGIKFENPFEDYGTIKRLNSKNQEIRITDNIIFEELHRFDISEIKIKEYLVNNEGDLLLCYNEDKILQINRDGELSNEFILPFIPEEKKLGVNPLKVLNGTDFLVNNYIFKPDNQIIQLTGDTELIKNRGSQHLNAYYYTDYDSLTQKYIVVNDEDIWKYNSKGKFESTTKQSITFKNQNNRTRFRFLINGKGLFIDRYDDNVVYECLINYDVRIVFEIEAKGYEYGSLSKKNSFLLNFGKREKAYIFDLKNKNKCTTLEIHPLKWKAYKDLHIGASDEYGFDRAAFSPDETYLVAGATFGKYIVWELPQCKRTELFPLEEYLKRMGGKIIEVGGQKILENDFWKNRVQSIHFFDDGDFFVMILKGKAILVWNRKFENVNFIGGLFNVDIHNDNFMSQVINGELILFKRRSNKATY